MDASAGEPPPLMDAEIIRLAQNHLHHQSSSPVPPYLLSPHSHSTIISHLTSRAAASPSPSAAVSEYTIALLSLLSLSPQTPPLPSLLSSLLVSYARIFASRQIAHDSNSLKTIQLFNTLIHHLPISDIQTVVDSIMSSLSEIGTLDDAQLLDLLPKCLSLIRGSNEIEGAEDFMNSTMDRLFDCVWSKDLLLKLVSLVKDFAFLGRERGREFMEKVFEGMESVELQDLPLLVYQLLVLASKGFCKREVIEGIVLFFGSKSGRKGGSIFRQVEGTVLLHLNFAVKQDPSLGQEVMGLLKSDSRAFNHFTIAVVLSIARIKKFNESSMGILRKGILAAYSDYTFAKGCSWLSNEMQEEFFNRVRGVEKAVLKAVNESNYAREHIVPSIMQLAFLLLTSVEEGNGKFARSSESIDCPLGIEELGVQILKTMFEVHDMARSEIIEQCKFRILSMRPRQSMPIIRLLGNLIQSYPYQMLEHVSRLKELLDYFTFMDGTLAAYLINSLLPLIKFSRDLLNYIILVVRKAMFRREDAIRLAAVTAIIDLILAEKKSKTDDHFSCQDSSSQPSSSQQAEVLCDIRGGLFQELIGLLQRCLYQQANVKKVMYSGLLKLVLVDPPSAGAVFDLLLPHFLRFFKEDPDVLIDISSCVKSESGKYYIEEPLDNLISCISWILLLHPQGKTKRPPDSPWPCFGFSLSQEPEAGRTLSFESFSTALLKIRDLGTGKLEAILGQRDGAASNSHDKERTKCCAVVLSGIIGVMLNNIASELEKSTGHEKADLEKELLSFIELHHSLEMIIATSKQIDGIKKANLRTTLRDFGGNSELGCTIFAKEEIPFLSTSSICYLIETVMVLHKNEVLNSSATSQKQSQASAGKASKCSKLIGFTLSSLLRHIKTSPAVGGEDPLSTLTYGDIKVLGTPLLKLIFLLKSGPLLNSSQPKARIDDQKEHLYQAMICFRELLTICSQNPHFTSFVEGLSSVSVIEYGLDNECEDSIPDDEQHTRSLDLLMVKTLRPLLSDLLALSSHREVEVLCDMILKIGRKLPSMLSNSHGSWAHEICKSNRIKNPKVAKSVATISICLSFPPNDVIIAQALAEELLKVLGSESSDPMEVSESYPIINKFTTVVLISCLLQLIETFIADIDWAVKKLKAFPLSRQKQTCFDQEREPALNIGLVFEAQLYSRSEAVIRVLSSFIVMNLKDTQADHLLRLLARFYKQLAQMSKLKIAPRGCKQLLPGLKFEKLVELTCKQLTVPLYSFMADMQKEQQENGNLNKGMMGKIKRENKFIPDLIFQIEDYEKYLIRLSKVTKVNLLRYAKRSTARDFKILEPARVGEQEEGDAPEGGTEQPCTGDELGNDSVEDNEGSDPANALSPESGPHLSVQEGGSDGEDGDDLPSAKRVKKGGRVVQDSDDDDEV
ncbi:Fanconi anemia group I protein isoform X1 [Punica granatum]|uniref:Fanconi anemia group I protein isoform X1 n=1 Tax=Punica granatum TaxID=22663 RepID=A0A6P8D4J7_PUNGR|nr:Fanconi anemia group I protein isoform X1 [Punica granatum]